MKRRISKYFYLFRRFFLLEIRLKFPNHFLWYLFPIREISIFQKNNHLGEVYIVPDDIHGM